MIVTFRSREGNRLKLRNFSPQAYGMYHGQDEIAISVPISNNRFFKDNLRISAALTALLMMSYLMLIFPVFAALVYLLNFQIDLIFCGCNKFYSYFPAIFGLFIIIFSGLYVIFFNIPIPMSKNRYNIRWGFLAPIMSRGIHPRATEWLRDK